MWLKIIVTPLMNGTVPVELEHYTTLVIQALDLAFVVPTAILAGILLFRKKTFGYLLAPIIIIKAAALLMAITAMIVMQMIRGIEVDMVQVGVFLVFDLIIVVCLAIIMRNIKEPKQ
jgi:biotin transporter BioY